MFESIKQFALNSSDAACSPGAQGGKRRACSSSLVIVETSPAIIPENASMVTKSLMIRGSTLFLRLVISLIAIAALAVCIFPVPRSIAKEAAKTPDSAWPIHIIMVGEYVQASLFLFVRCIKPSSC